MLLKEIQKSKFRRIRVKQFLLMLVRILIIVFLVLAFADPFIRNYASTGSDMRKTGIIFTDSSFSMNVMQDSSKLISTALAERDEIEKYFSSSDELKYFYPKVNTGDTSDIMPKKIRPGLNSILNIISEYKTAGKNTEVFIISDLQKYNFENQITDAGNLSDINFYFIDVSGAKPGNVSVNNVLIETKIPGPSGTIDLRAVVKNYGSNFISGARISLYTENNKVEEKYFDLNPEERKEIALSYSASKSGNTGGYVELSNIASSDDNIREDNRFSFNLFIPEKIRIGILSGGNISSKYLRAVFDAGNKNTSSSNSIYDYSEIYSINDADGYDVLILNGYNIASEPELDMMKKHLSAGKGLFVFPGENSNFSYLNKLASFNYADRIISGKRISFSDVKTGEPLFEGLFSSKQADESRNLISPVTVNSHYGIVYSQNSYPLITMNNLLPFILEDRSYSGVIIASSVSADLSMSDFPKNEFFAPLILRAAGFLSYGYLAEENHSILNNHDTLESNLDRIDNKGLKEYLAKSGLKKFEIVGRSDMKNLQSIVEENRRGKSFWKYAVAAVLLLVLAELFLVKKFYKNQ